MRSVLLAILTVASPTFAADPVDEGSRVVFLGDSNTFAGRFIAYLDAELIVQFPNRKIELINLGLPSETVSGLSEPDHPYPRPNVHTRLDAALAKSKPNVVIACYGMNDGIYSPFDEDRFQKFQDGFRRLIASCEKVGAQVILMTPAPFDPTSLKDKVLPKGAAKYSWMRPFEDYDGVLTRYSEWLVAFRRNGYTVVDSHMAVREHLARMRKTEAGYRVSGDGIHPDANGHFVIFRELAKSLKLADDGVSAAVDANQAKSATDGVTNVTVDDSAVEFTWKSRLPFPRDRAWHRNLVEMEGIAAGRGRFRLTVTGLPAGQHDLYEADRKVGTASAEEWKAGVDLGRFSDLSLNRRAADLWKLVEEKNRTLGLAWLTDVGHERPDTPKGIPLKQAQEKAMELHAKARQLAVPTAIRLRVVPAK